MAVTEGLLDAIVAEANRIVAAGTRSNLEKALRAAFPDVRITVCLEEDVVQRPIREEAAYLVHLVGGGGHCLGLTKNLDGATGVVLALRDEDET